MGVAPRPLRKVCTCVPLGFEKSLFHADFEEQEDNFTGFYFISDDFSQFVRTNPTFAYQMIFLRYAHGSCPISETLRRQCSALQEKMVEFAINVCHYYNDHK